VVKSLARNCSLAYGTPNAALAKAKNCMTCHAVSTKLVGPSFQAIAKRYAGQKGAEEKRRLRCMGLGVDAGTASQR
jgi:cytochrome c